MKLNLEQIRGIALGVDRVDIVDGAFMFHRFTHEQEELYKIRRDDFYRKAFSPSGVCLRFMTDSENLYLKAEVALGTAKDFFSFDLCINGERVDSLCNYVEEELPENYSPLEFVLGEYEKNFSLGAGEKEVALYLPWSVIVKMKELSLDDGCSIVPVKPKYRIMNFGDSITQGYHSLHPIRKYTTQLAAALDAQEHNKAIGGEIFFPELAATKDNFVPDYITVAYGTNDVSRCEWDEIKENCRAFLKNLHNIYPDVKTFVLTPIWRKAFDDVDRYAMIEGIIREAAAEYENMVVIRGYDFVPHSESSFGDLILHPNNQGFDRYFKNLYKEIKPLI